MSLLEDVFLQDEAGEAQELERIIEDRDDDERPRTPQDSDENSEKEDEAEEDKRRVDPSTTKTKREVKHPRFVLNPARLTGPRGIQVIPEHFKDFKFKGKGHEKDDLDLVLKKLEHWAYRLYPKFQFADCLKKIETLGKKRPVMVHLHKIRSDQLQTEETVVQQDSSDDEAQPPQQDEFDVLLQQQIDLARATPASVRKPFSPGDDRSPLNLPSATKATSSPSISDEQRERMILNRKLAEERRLAKLRAATDQNGTQNNDRNEIEENFNDQANNKNTDGNSKNFDDLITGPDNTQNDRSEGKDDYFPSRERYDKVNYDFDSVRNVKNVAQKRKSQVIDSDSDSDLEDVTINQNITVDIHRVSSQFGSQKEATISEMAINDTIDLVGKDADLTKKRTKISASKAKDDVINLDEDNIVIQKSTTEMEMVDLIQDTDTNKDRVPVVDLIGDINNIRQINTAKIIDGEIIDLIDAQKPTETGRGGKRQKKLLKINTIDSSDEDSDENAHFTDEIDLNSDAEVDNLKDTNHSGQRNSNVSENEDQETIKTPVDVNGPNMVD